MGELRLWFIKEYRSPEIVGPFPSEDDARDWAKSHPYYYGRTFGELAEIFYWEALPNVEP